MPLTEQVRYTRIAIVLHWGIAGLIILNLSIGWFMEGLAEPGRTLVVRLHQSSGMTVLVLTAARIAWRLTHRPPPLDRGLSAGERRTAGAVHSLFYLAMLAMPLSGWALISANPPRYAPAGGHIPPGPRAQRYIMLWGVVPLHPIAPIQAIAAEPGGVARQHALHARITRLHKLAGYGLLALLLLHIVGALKHQMLDGQAALSRMGIGRAGRRRGSPAARARSLSRAET